MKLEDYLAYLHPGQWFGFDGEHTYENLVILDDQYEKPTEQECLDRIKRLEAEQEIRRVDALRKSAYESESDPIFMKWKRGEATEQEWLDKIAEIKERFPKPE